MTKKIDWLKGSVENDCDESADAALNDKNSNFNAIIASNII